MLVAGLEAALAPGGNAADPQPSTSHGPSAGRRHPAHQLWCLLCLEADAHGDRPRVFLPGACYCSKAPGEQTLQGGKG